MKLKRFLSIRHILTRPFTPRTNEKAERLIQTLLPECASRFTYSSLDERRSSLVPYMHLYNVHRAHSSSGDNPPISRLDRNDVLTRDS